jgi:hypothetical protein
MEGQIMPIRKLQASFILLVAILFVSPQGRILAASSTSAAPATSSADNRAKNTPPQPPSDGERAFRQNCSRCHQAPGGFPTQISGTIVRHMRVRANLNQEDERAILKFLNP